jgi:hypothetical protein
VTGEERRGGERRGEESQPLPPKSHRVKGEAEEAGDGEMERGESRSLPS